MNMKIIKGRDNANKLKRKWWLRILARTAMPVVVIQNGQASIIAGKFNNKKMKGLILVFIIISNI